MISRPVWIWLNRLLWTFLVGAVLVLGVLVSLGRHYLPYVEAHQTEIVAALKQRTGLSISVGHLRAYWQYLSPHLVVDDFKLYSPEYPEQAVLQIQHLEVRLGLFRSIDSHTLAISKLEGSGVRVSLTEAALGHWHLSGFSSSSNVDFDRVLDALLAIYRAKLRDTHVDLHFFGGGEAELIGEQLRLQRVGDFRRLNLALGTADRAAPLTLVIEANGDPRWAEHFSASGYAVFSKLDLSAVLPTVKAAGNELQNGRVDGEVWLDWRPDADIELRGHLSTPHLDLAGLTGRDLPPLTNLAVQFLLRDKAEQRQLWLPQLTMQCGATALSFSHLRIAEDGLHPDVLQVQIPTLALSPLRAALLQTKLPDAARQALVELAPVGTLRNAWLAVPISSQHRDAFRLRTEVADLTVGSWHGAPGASGIAGYLDMGLHEGIFDLAAANMALVFPQVYREALRFDTVRAQVGWELAPDRVLVYSGPIRADSAAGEASVLLALDIPHAIDAASSMTLQVGLQHSGAEYRDRFLPYTLPPTLLTWLGAAVQGGTIPAGGFIYRGAISGASHLGTTVQLFLDVRDGRLKYQPDWPELADIRAAVWVDDADLLVQSPSARSFDQIRTRDVQVEMHPGADGSWLTVRGDVVARDDDVLRLLRESPLHQHVGTALDHWRWRGVVNAQLDLGFAIGGVRPAQLRVDSELGSGQLALVDQGLLLTAVRGPLQYRSGTGLQSSAIAADWYGKPLTAEVSVDSNGALKVAVVGRAAAADISDWLQQPALGYASGTTDFRALLQVVGAHSELSIASDLLGVEIKLPPPYAKAANETLPLALTMPMTGNRKLTATLGGLIDLNLQWSDTQVLQSGVLRLGGVGDTTISSNRLVVTGVVPAVDLDQWGDLVEYLHTSVSSTKSVAVPLSSVALPLSLELRDLRLGEVSFAGQTLRDVTLAGQRGDNGWRLYVTADRAAGSVLLPSVAEQPWRVHLDYLHLPASTPGTAVSSIDSFDPAKVLPIDLRIDRLWRGDESWGWLELQLRPVTDGLVVQQLIGELRGIRIEPRVEQPASLSWLRQSGVDHSSFTGRLGVADIGDVLQRWRFERVLTSTSGYLDADINWTGRPDQATLHNTDGKVRLEITEGRFLKVSGSTAGALKVVGIFDFANFLRRLQLDFSDVFKDGVSFDTLQGGLSVQQSILTTTTPVEIKSPSSTFRIAGAIDFNTDQTDMELVATLPVARNLPWIAALAVNLPAAAGVYVASKIFGDRVDNFTSVAYDIDGPWRDPQVKLRRIFDAKLPPKAALDAAVELKKNELNTTHAR